ncbi:MAG: tRNA (adenosine(37)-N6)-dimethylallyltransferase MiaA [Candidatus Aminicenantes bacterium]|nr:tRNA (adenosine(37)-N6)-dimethylallyltransferase MiaA [Candidatus Aminicenantes bacterium]
MFAEAKKILIIVGPTAVGKTATALWLAQEFSGEIISCDSMQVYRGFDIGTDKPSLEERKKVRHHLIDFLDPSQQFSAADFAFLALEIAEDIIARRHLPIVVGGTGLYHRALTVGLFKGPGRDQALRQKLKEEARAFGLEKLYHKLRQIDPEYANKITPKDSIRIIRALEVYHKTGRPISEHFRLTKSPLQARGFIPGQIGLKLERKELYRRIEERVNRMFERGLVAEVRKLLEQGLTEEAAPFKGLGYRQVLRYLKGEISLEEAIELTKLETRHYAKRQMTWFRKTPGLTWFQPTEKDKIRKYVKSFLAE